MCFFIKQKTAYEMRISDWSSDVCSSDLRHQQGDRHAANSGGQRVPGPVVGVLLAGRLDGAAELLPPALQELKRLAGDVADVQAADEGTAPSPDAPEHLVAEEIGRAHV